jgi:alpha-galactosidase
MKMRNLKNLLLTVLFCIAAAVPVLGQKFEELAQTPPMGWNSWNTFQTKIDEPLLKGMVDTYVSSGMRDAGYTYFVLDDGWMTMERDKDGNLVADPKKFPNGMKAFADYVHSKGLKFGIYNCAGTKTCAGYPGTRGYEYQDARLYASWGVDYLKFDWCNTDGINAKEAYGTMAKAIRAAGRPMIFSLCEWGQHMPWKWAGKVGQLWRSTGDIGNAFEETVAKNGWKPLSVLNILDRQDSIRQYAGPGHWNDPDMLEVGNGMKYNEDKAHFSLWCMLAAPLMAGNDLRKMSQQTTAILNNKEAIAIDQDPLGVQCFKYYSFDGLEIFVKPLSNNELAVCFLNRSNRPQNVNFDWKEHAIADTVSKTTVNFGKTSYKLRDVWAKKDIGTTDKAFKQTIGVNDVVMLRLAK